MSKAFHPDFDALMAAMRAVQAALSRVSLASGGTTGEPPGIVASDYCVEDTGEGFQLVTVDSALGAIEEFEPFSPGFYRRFGRVHYLMLAAMGGEEDASAAKRIGEPWGALADTFLFQAWEAAAASGESDGDLDELTAAVETLRGELARLKRWKDSAGRKARRFGT